ncbi:Adult-specific rigid cuticular protein 15.7, partial [Araneus ventricosus]
RWSSRTRSCPCRPCSLRWSDRTWSHPWSRSSSWTRIWQ